MIVDDCVGYFQLTDSLCI